MPTIHVPSDQPTIAAAIAVAAPGDTIQLDAGYTNESATVTLENLTFAGDFGNTGITLTLGPGIATVFFAGTAPWAVVDNASDNSIAASDGSDRITVTGGNDIVGGGVNIGGFDTLIVNYASATTDIVTNGDPAAGNLGNGEYTDGGDTSVDFTGIERFVVTTGSGNDTIVTANNLGPGNLNDIVSTGGGNDSINTQQGTAIVNGGTGTDFWTAQGLGPISLNLNLAGTQNIGGGSQVTSIERVNLALSGSSTVVTRVGNPNDGLNDTISDPTGGNDTVTVGGGNDVFDAGLGTDTLIVNYATETAAITTTGNPADTFGPASSYTDGGNTSVTFTGVERFQITTGSGADTIVTGNGNDTVSTGGGNDTIDTRGGTAIVDGGSGTDTWIAQLNGTFPDPIVLDLNISTTQFLGNGDQVTSIERVNITTGGPAIIITRVGNPNDGLNDTIIANGNSTVTVGGGLDTVSGAFGGSDTLIVNYATETAAITTIGDPADASVWSQYTDGVNTGVTFIDIQQFQITTGSGADTIVTGNNADVINGGAGADSMTGLFGDDTYVVDNAGDQVIEAAGAGIDLVQSSITHALAANVDNLTLTGGAAIGGTGNVLNNVITGNSAANTLTGFGGNDRLDGRAGADAMSGGNGNDTYIVDNAGDTASEASGSGVDTVLSTVTFTLATGLENLTLSGSAAINGTGNASANAITGNSAANVLSGLAGNDTLTGLGGNDRLDGGAGGDSMSGGNGDDTYIVDNAGDTVSEASGSGTDLVQSSVGFTLASGIENLTLTGAAINGAGNPGANAITGTSAANTLSGLAGSDTLTGFGGNDRLDGGAGADAMIGGNGDDTYIVDNAGDTASEAAGSGTDLVQSAVTFSLGTGIENLTLTGTAAINGTGNGSANTMSGNSAANRLDGNGGNDTLTGFGGADVFVFDEGDGADTITDFANGTDTFDLTAVAGVDEFSDLGVIDNGPTVTVSYGTGSFTLANIGNAAVVDASDFVFA